VKIRSRISSLSACLCAMPLAHALGLGGITGSGGPGLPLDAQVALYLAPGDRAALTGVELLPDLTLDAAADRALLARIAASIEHRPDGSFVRLASAEPLMVDRLRFRLRLNTARGAVTAHYALRMPALRPTLAPVTGRSRDIVARPVPRRPSARAPQAPTVAPGEGRYGPVRPGQSLWLIAKELTGGRDLERMMSALHALNPQAFVGGDPAKLRVGVTLQLPADDAATSAAAAPTVPVAPARREEESAPVRNAAPAAAILRREPAAGTRADEGATARTRMLPDPELRARLAELDAKFAAIRAKYAAPAAATNEATGGPGVGLPTVEAPDAPAAPAAPAALVTAPVADAARPVIAEAPPAVQTPPPAPVQAPVAAATRDSQLPPAAWLTAGALLLGIAAWGAQRALQFRGARRTKASVEQHNAADADRRAEVARKAENRVRLESEIKGMNDRRLATPGGSLATSVQDHGVTPLPVLAAAPMAGDGAEAPRDATRETAIDTSIAHGRYAEAEVLLREVLEEEPGNVPAKLRLAELFYITEQAERFAELAADLKARDRANLTDEEWKRVVRMGKILAPELMPFSGPRVVGLDA
jgi:pilus assembly protein FimV